MLVHAICMHHVVIGSLTTFLILSSLAVASLFYFTVASLIYWSCSKVVSTQSTVLKATLKLMCIQTHCHTEMRMCSQQRHYCDITYQSNHGYAYNVSATHKLSLVFERKKGGRGRGCWRNESHHCHISVITKVWEKRCVHKFAMYEEASVSFQDVKY